MARRKAFNRKVMSSMLSSCRLDPNQALTFCNKHWAKSSLQHQGTL